MPSYSDASSMISNSFQGLYFSYVILENSGTCIVHVKVLTLSKVLSSHEGGLWRKQYMSVMLVQLENVPKPRLRTEFGKDTIFRDLQDPNA